MSRNFAWTHIITITSHKFEKTWPRSSDGLIKKTEIRLTSTVHLVCQPFSFINIPVQLINSLSLSKGKLLDLLFFLGGWSRRCIWLRLWLQNVVSFCNISCKGLRSALNCLLRISSRTISGSIRKEKCSIQGLYFFFGFLVFHFPNWKLSCESLSRPNRCFNRVTVVPTI